MSTPPDGSSRQAAEAAETPVERLRHPLIGSLLLEPSEWRIWPAVAILRWLLSSPGAERPVLYRSLPSLGFPTAEIHDVTIGESKIELTVTAPGLASAGSAMPASYIARIIDDWRRGGALAEWLDGLTDRFMQATELAEARNNMAFSLATGGEVHLLNSLGRMVGNAATLSANADGELSSSWARTPSGAVGLAAFFVGEATMSGLEQLVAAFAGLPVRGLEFAGAEVATLRPARVGGRFGAILGAKCRLAAAGVELIMEGGSNPDALRWGQQRVRRESLHRLAAAYIGSQSPEMRFFLELDPENAPPATLDGGTELGGVAILGKAESPVLLPLIAEPEAARSRRA